MPSGSVREVTRALSEVARLSTRPSDVDALLRGALDALADAIPYDLAAVLELVSGHLEVRCARGPLADASVLHHRIAVEPGSTVEKALHTRRARVMEAHEHGAGRDPYHGVVDLPDGHGCLVVPLVAADEAVGVMTFDRASCSVYSQETVDLATVYGQLVALALVAARHAESLARDNARLSEENRRLAAEAGAGGLSAERLTDSRAPAMERALELARQVAVTDAPVLLTGETGTGKEIMARAVHEWSPRRDRPFVKLNCAALPENLVESELFGHVKGAFSGAERDRPGRFQVADTGTLLLDEVGDLPLAAQAKLLRVLQEGSFEPVGSDRPVQVDVRLLAATHVDLQRAIEAGRFREDLYYRLSLFPIHLPPLRERPGDGVRIAERFLADHAARTGRGPWTLSEASRGRIEAYRWPGNVRELVNALERATILTPRGALEVEPVPVPSARVEAAAASLPSPGSPDGAVWPTLQAVERDYFERTLDRKSVV